MSGYEQHIDFKNAQENGIAVVDNNLQVTNGYTLSAKSIGDNHDSNKFSVMTVTHGKSNSIRVFNSNQVSNPVKTIAAHKDVKAGIKDTATKASIAGKAVVKGQALTYELSMDDLPANRATDIRALTWQDTLPKYVDYAGFKVFNVQGEDVTSNYAYQGDNKRQFTLKAKPEALAAIHADKVKAYKSDRVEIYTNANEDGVNFKNNAKLTLNNRDYDTNAVTNQTPNYHTIKKDVNTEQNDYNNKNVKPGDTVHYQIIGDLSEMQNMALTPDQINEDTFQLSDKYDETRLDVTDAVKKSFKIAILKDDEQQTDQDENKASESGQSASSQDSAATTTTNSGQDKASSSKKNSDSVKAQTAADSTAKADTDKATTDPDNDGTT